MPNIGGRNKRRLEFSELFNKWERGWNFRNFLINLGEVDAIPKQGVGHCSEDLD